jgi:hypothetical protein
MVAAFIAGAIFGAIALALFAIVMADETEERK